MANNKPIINTFGGGLDWDNHIQVTDNTTYKYAENLIDSDNLQTTFKSNEHSNRLLHKYNVAIVGRKYINKLNSTVVLLENGEIHLFNHDTEVNKFVAVDTEFNCDWGFNTCEWVNVLDYEEYICDLYITYSSNKVYYNINLSELLDPKRKEGLKESLSNTCGTGCAQKTCEYFKVFKKVCDPHIEALVLDGGSLRNGTYFISGRYINDTGGYSNPFPLTQAIHISGNDNIGGEISNKRIEITIQNFSCVFDQIELYVHEYINGQSLTKVLPPTYISSNNFTLQYTGNEGLAINSVELLLNKRTYIEGEDLYIHNNRALYYRVTPEFEYNFQPIANGITTRWVALKVPLVDIKRYNIKSLLRNETYAFAISPNWITGRKGYGFHIPGSPSSGGCNNDSIAKGSSGSNININEVLNIKSPSKSLTNPLSKINNIPLPTSTKTTSDTSSINSSSTDSTNPVTVPTGQGILYKRVRSSIPSTVNNPHEDLYTDVMEGIVDEWVTEMDDICKAIEAGCGDIFGSVIDEFGNLNCDCGDAIDAMCDRERRKQLAELCRQDHLKADTIASTWFNTLSEYVDETSISGTVPGFSISDNKEVRASPAKILHNPVSVVNKLKNAAQSIIDAVKKRERGYYDYKPYKKDDSGISYSSESVDQSQQFTTTTNNQPSQLSSFTFKQIETSNKEFTYEVEKGIYKKYPIIAKGNTIPKTEVDKYPCNTDCNGNPIYCSLAGTNITHHKMPSNTTIPYWLPKGTGNEDIMNGYGIVLTIEFDNINIPSQIIDRLCPTNPYNIGIVPRTSRNSSIIFKGIASETFRSTRYGKSFLYGNIGGNSFERCSKYIDIDGTRMDPGAPTDPNNILIYSADQLLKKPFLNGTHIRREGTFIGKGDRHFLYVKGEKAQDRRESTHHQRGSVHTAGITSYTPSDTRFELLSQIYSESNQVISPPSGNNTPLMNKHNQEAAWVSAAGIARSIRDNSFVGDVLQDKAPIDRIEMDYYSIEKELLSQYGDIASLNYVPVLQARGFQSNITGIVGDTYIAAYSFVKTHFVSDRVGNYFPVGNMVPGKVDRCICDDPEDSINSETGGWYWKTLPIDGDAADAKRWCGLHTTSITKTWTQSKDSQTESHYYFPKTTKHLISYVGEFDTNPYLREKSDNLEDQWYPEIKPLFSLHSSEIENGNWKDGFLNLFYALLEQAPFVKLALKRLIQTFIKIALPLIGINDWTNAESGIAFTGDMVAAVLQMAVWLLVSQVLFTNDFVDKWLGLDPCKKDEDGGEDAVIEKFFTNYDKYNMDYSIDYAFPTIKGLPHSYTGCYCPDATINSIYISEENDITSNNNGYQLVKPRSVLNLEESYGKLTKVYSIRDNLYLHTTDGVFATKFISVNPSGDIADTILGYRTLANPYLITNNSDEGSYGLEHPNHGKLTSMGFIFVDYNSRDICVFNGQSFDVLSGPMYKMSNFFKTYLPFCTHNGCRFEQTEGTNYYSIGIDPRFSRILFTKADGDYSYTLSFNYKKRIWSSFHSYIPQEYINDRNDMYSLHDNGIWKHDVYDKFTTYYDEYFGVRLDFNSIEGQNTMHYLSTEIFTEALIDGLRDRDTTFNSVNMSNSFQSTGEIQLLVNKTTDNTSGDMSDKIKDKTSSIDLTRMPNSFRFNEIHNYNNVYDAPIVTYDPCIPKPIIYDRVDYSDRSIQNYNNKIVLDNYMYYKYIFKNFANVKLYLKSIVTYIKNDIV